MQSGRYSTSMLQSISRDRKFCARHKSNGLQLLRTASCPIMCTFSLKETDESDCKRFIARAKQYFGYQHAAKFNERLWQRYAFERVLREDETTAVVARYI